MAGPEENFKINLNQNLWGLVVAYGSLGAAEHYHLYTLYWFSVAASIVMVLSVAATTLAYSVNYWKQKLGK